MGKKYKKYLEYDNRKAYLNYSDEKDGFSEKELSFCLLSDGKKNHGCYVDWKNGDLPDNRQADSFHLPYKSLPPKKFGINWFPNLDEYTASESRKIFFHSGK
jgi:hypothetical protein